MVAPTLRTKSVGTKVTAEEYDKLQALAGSRPLAEWVRDVLLKEVQASPTPVVPATGADDVLLGELLALRTILLNVLFKLTNGEAITAPQMQQLIDRADADKLKKAADRLGARGEGVKQEKI